MPGGKGNIKPADGRQFSKDYQPQQKWTEKKAIELAKNLIEWLKEKDEDGNDKGNIFFREFLIIDQDLGAETISYLCKKFSSFSNLIEKAKNIQEIKLVKYGVADRLNANMTKFILINHHDYNDRQHITSLDITPPQIEYYDPKDGEKPEDFNIDGA